MRVLVAGATSVPGLPLLRELTARGHEVVGLTRSSSKASEIEAAGRKPVVADVFDADEIDTVVADIEPEVVSLLTTLPKWGPKRPKDFEPAKKLWSTAASNLVGAAQRAGVGRIVAESVVFEHSDTEGIVLRYGLFTGRACRTTKCSSASRSGGRYRR
jgi:nucleoside-diphosphate-sugar epimerase